MIGKILINFIFIISLAITQISFIKSLPGWFTYINIIFIALVFILEIISFRYALTWAIALGFIVDLFSFSFFGFHLVMYPLIIYIINILFVNFFTDRSLYSFLVLVITSLMMYKFIFYLFNWFMSIFGIDLYHISINKMFWLNNFYELLINIISVIVVFYLVNIISRGVGPAFIIRKR